MFEEDETSNDQHSFGGSWTLIKLETLEKYLKAFNIALSKQTFTRVYIDGFAGTGRCEIKIRGEKTNIDGSARRALSVIPGFHKFCFIELETKKKVALELLQEEYPDKSIEIIQGDANLALKKVCKEYNWKNTRAVLFLDPYGLQVEWSTLEQIAETKAIDIWYLFPLAGLYRQMAKNANALDADKENAITRILGTDEWKQVFYKPSPQDDLFGHNSGDVRDASHKEILKFVSVRLGKLFPSVLEPKILYKNKDRGAPLFALYFGISNPGHKAIAAAKNIANHILNSL
jgi:three-Cys-motif partner protein